MKVQEINWSLRMCSFLIFISIMAFTPGPNNVVAMTEGKDKGLVGSLRFVMGSLIGAAFVALITSCFSSLISDNNWALFILRVLGSVYLLYLTWHFWIDRESDNVEEGLTSPFRSGILIQITNVKIYLVYISAFTGFSNILTNNSILYKSLWITLFVFLGTMLWAVCGDVLKGVIEKHLDTFSFIVACLLCLTAIDLWM